MHFKTPVWEVPSHFSQFVGYQNITSKVSRPSVKTKPPSIPLVLALFSTSKAGGFSPLPGGGEPLAADAGLRRDGHPAVGQQRAYQASEQGKSISGRCSATISPRHARPVYVCTSNPTPRVTGSCSLADNPGPRTVVHSVRGSAAISTIRRAWTKPARSAWR